MGDTLDYCFHSKIVKIRICPQKGNC
jgi:hypothetical protein